MNYKLCQLAENCFILFGTKKCKTIIHYLHHQCPNWVPHSVIWQFWFFDTRNIRRPTFKSSIPKPTWSYLTLKIHEQVNREENTQQELLKESETQNTENLNVMKVTTTTILTLEKRNMVEMMKRIRIEDNSALSSRIKESRWRKKSTYKEKSWMNYLKKIPTDNITEINKLFFRLSGYHFE